MTIPLIVNGVTFDYPEKGDTGWADDATGWANAITNALDVNLSPLTTKGDIFTYSTEPTRLGVGPNGTVLVADSSQETGLHWLSVPGVSGSVTGFTFIDANGFHGFVTTPTTTPQLLLSMDTLPVSGGGTGSTTADGAFDSIAPTTTVGDIIVHNGTTNIRLPGNSVPRQYVLSNNGFGVLSWSLPTYGRAAVINTPADLNNLPSVDLSVEGYGDFIIQGLIGNLSNRPTGSALPASGSTQLLGPGNNAFQTFQSSGSPTQWIRRKLGGIWLPWQEAALPDQTGHAGKVLGTNGSTTAWQTGGGGGGGGALNEITNAFDDAFRQHGPYEINWSWQDMVGPYGTGPLPIRHSGLVLHGVQAAVPGEHPIVLRVGVASGSTCYPFEVYLEDFAGGALVVDNNALVHINYGADISGLISADTIDASDIATDRMIVGEAFGIPNIFNVSEGAVTPPGPGQIRQDFAILSGGNGLHWDHWSGPIGPKTGIRGKSNIAMFISSIPGGASDTKVEITTFGDIIIGDSTNGLFFNNTNKTTMINGPFQLSSDNVGTATIVGGVVVVANTKVSTASKIQLTYAAAPTTPGFLYVGVVVNNASFEIRSTAATNATVHWMIIN